uniref:WIZ zinc finger n=1 Tax=Scleropages formosus TaxID=113540 RepID=A0A8C9R8N5_SCLFO
MRCEFCTPFETRRGLSSHARSHLRQLGISVSESSGAPIDLLYQLIKERDGPFSPTQPPPPPPVKKTQHGTPTARKEVPGARVGTKVAALENKPAAPLSPLSTASKAPPSTSRSSSPSVFVKSRSASPSLKKAPISSLLPTSSPRHTMESKLGSGKTPSASVASAVSAKPFWAPQETDAPLNLSGLNSHTSAEVDAGKEIVCQLCGAWFETRKGLSSHARAHLRHFGVVDAETKGSPIDLLNQLIHTDDFKHRANTLLPELSEGGSIRASLPPASTLSSGKRPVLPLSPTGLHKGASAGGCGSGMKSTARSVLLSPPVKRFKPSSAEKLHFVICLSSPTSGEPLKEIACEFCGEYFENRKGLSSHARSHLRQLGVTEWSVNGSPIDTLRELITRRGLPCAMPIRPLKSPPSSPGAPRSPPVSPSSPALIKRLPVALSHGHQPTARKAGAVIGPAIAVKPKVEPVNFFVFCCNLNSVSSFFFSTIPSLPAPAAEPEPARDIRCEFCGEYFENRKGLSSHARSHLRQLGITEWSVNGSPIDTLRELMLKNGTTPAGQVKKEPGLSGGGAVWDESGYLSPKFSPPTTDASCELCGFYFENRKALASHARAHLRQFGVTEWCVNGSPIETLSAWMRSRPQKVAEIHKRYLQGDRPFPKKVKIRPSLGSTLGRRAGREITGGGWVSSRPGHGGTPSPQALHGLSRQTLPHAQVARSELNVRTLRGFERRPPKHLSHSESGERDRTPPQPPRTGTIPALVPKPPSTPLVKLVGKIYSLKCRFCEVEFHGPLSVQEDWVRHLQQHILDLNFNKADPPSTPSSANAPVPAAVSPPAATQESIPAATATPLTSAPTPTATPTSTPSPSPVVALTPTPVSTSRPPSASGISP